MENSTTGQCLVRKGACLCGGIQFELTGEPSLSLMCHCSNCRKTSGSSFSASVVFQKTQIKIFDDRKVLRTYNDSKTETGALIQRDFCGNCGSSLFLRSAKLDSQDNIVVSSGGVEDTKGWRPKSELFCRGRKEWLPEIPGIESVM